MRILAVDDEQLALRSLGSAIRNACPDAELTCCDTAQAAWKMARETPFDVAFLDVEMGELGGLELARRLREIDTRTKVVFVTAFSQYAFDAFSVRAAGYLLKPVAAESVAEELRHLEEKPSVRPTSRVQVRTFGNFEVICDGRPVAFPRTKAKELFAYLVHKRGSGCTVRELSSVLFEERGYTLSVQRQMQTIIATMMKAFKDAGAEGVVVKGFNSLAVNVDAVECDYYRFLEGDVAAVNSYMGEYMANYGWSEFVVGYLDGCIKRKR